MSNIEQVGADAWRTWVEENDALLLDIREPFEWQQTGVLPDAKLISMGELPTSLDQLDQDTPIRRLARLARLPGREPGRRSGGGGEDHAKQLAPLVGRGHISGPNPEALDRGAEHFI